MEEIKVGEYVRTKKHGTFKVTDISKTEYGYYRGLTDNEKFSTFTIGKRLGGSNEIKKDIVKHSPNLIDLIEEGDYVNGDRMDIVIKDENGHTYYMQNCELPSVNLKDIKSIVTHEQFAQIEYKVEE